MSLSKEEVLQSRAEFFGDVLAFLQASPRAIDEALEQVKYYIEPNMVGLINDPEFGDFYVKIDPFFGGKVWPLAYSMWQIGQQLRVAIILQAHSEDAPYADPSEFAELWPGVAMAQIQRGAKLYLEWRFDVPDFHTNYAVREGFALGMRHLHFRALKAIRVLASRLAASSTMISLEPRNDA